ncbi:glycoside hydrolase family 127 protein [Treponema zuelzerae]|uniref:Glycoside hydrolase family 127 protein n=1 Tax=Teretinema zuelzerae TaxID=156 RepID=A0AAE3EM86_9SPIR|nr:beta-L-arabinofuranosidase domain-containing protein [Teretinema zuelzerae]MCD1655894.1 glycoside hydrolase family 127 protein [Teretinema zuelzerae]
MNLSSQNLTVRLAPDSLLGRSQAVGLEYVLALDADRLLSPCWIAAGRELEAKGRPYGGWESRQIAGHSLGHYLSALSGFVEATGSETARKRLDYAVSELGRLQRSDGYIGGVPSAPFDAAFSGTFQVENFSLAGYWVPWYSVHKIYAGLIEAYRRAGNAEALRIVTGMADWAANGLSRMSDADFQRMLVCEHGGMCLAFADLYSITRDERYLELAVRWIHRSVVDPLTAGKDSLQGLHANTQIPKIIGLARLYELTGKTEYRRGVEFFWENVTKKRSYAIGGNSIGEHFGPAGKESLGKDTCETCNTYNMIELGSHVFSWTGSAEVSEFCERALYNHILASQEPDTGAKTYFVSTQPGHFKVYGTVEDSFWCCTGTGMENPERYGKTVWSLDGDALSLLLFAPSTVSAAGWEIEASGDPFRDGTMTLRVMRSETTVPRLRIRQPSWNSAPLSLSSENVVERGGWFEIDGLKAGDSLSITFDPIVRMRTAMGNDSLYSFEYGPFVLAACLGVKGFPGEKGNAASDTVGDHLSLMNWPGIPVPPVIADVRRPADFIAPAGDWKKDGILFETISGAIAGGERLFLKPFHEVHHERYTIYFSAGTGAAGRDERFAASTVDLVKPGEQQSEIEHGMKKAESSTGYIASLDMRWREAAGPDGYISCRMKFDPSRPAELLVAWHDMDGPRPGLKRRFDIVVNGSRIAAVDLVGSGEDRAVDSRFAVPAEVLAGLPAGSGGLVEAEVMFKPAGKRTAAGKILEVRSLRVMD